MICGLALSRFLHAFLLWLRTVKGRYYSRASRRNISLVAGIKARGRRLCYGGARPTLARRDVRKFGAPSFRSSLQLRALAHAGYERRGRSRAGNLCEGAARVFEFSGRHELSGMDISYPSEFIPDVADWAEDKSDTGGKRRGSRR